MQLNVSNSIYTLSGKYTLKSILLGKKMVFIFHMNIT